MTIGEKIKYYRTTMGLTQAQLGALSGLNVSTIKKLETNLLNPKPKMLMQVADALCVSFNIFTDFDIETDSDVISLITKMDEKIDMKFEAEYDKDGKPIPDTVKISFTNPSINEKLASFAKQKKSMDTLDAHKRATPKNDSEVIEQMDAKLEMIRLELCRGAQIVTKK